MTGGEADACSVELPNDSGEVVGRKLSVHYGK